MPDKRDDAQNNRSKRNSFLRAGFKSEIERFQDPNAALRFAMDVLNTNSMAMATLIVINDFSPIDDLHNTDLLICMEFCFDSIDELVRRYPDLLSSDDFEAWKYLFAAFQGVSQSALHGSLVVFALLLLACGTYIIERHLGRPFVPESNFHEEYVKYLRSLAPPVSLNEFNSRESLRNCVIHLRKLQRQEL